MRYLVTTLLLTTIVCIGCGGGDKIKMPTDQSKIEPGQVKISGWGGGGDTKPSK